MRHPDKDTSMYIVTLGCKGIAGKGRSSFVLHLPREKYIHGILMGCIRGSYPSTEEKQEIYNCYACYDIPEKGGINLFLVSSREKYYNQYLCCIQFQGSYEGNQMNKNSCFDVCSADDRKK